MSGSREPRGDRALRWLFLGVPAVVLSTLVLVPLILLVVFSFYRKVSGGSYEPAFTFENYVRFFQPLYLERLWFTLEISALTAAACLVIGLPFTYYLARMASPRRRRAALTLTIATLWLTYVVRAFGWSVLLSRSGGVGRLLAWLGLYEVPPSFTPGFGAELIGFVYVYLPFMILALYGALRSLPRELEEASMNLGAGPFRTFLFVVLPLTRRGIAAGLVLVFLLAMGTYVIPVVLGRPEHWTLPVLITDQVSFEANVPFGAAMALLLALLVGGIFALSARWLGRAGLGGVMGRG